MKTPPPVVGAPKQTNAIASGSSQSGIGGNGGLRHPVCSVMSFIEVSNLLLVEVEDEETYGGRKIAVLPLGIDRADQVRQRRLSPDSDFLQRPPKLILEAYARLVASQDDGPLDHQ